MSERSQDTITRALLAWGAGQADALDRLYPMIYEELRRIAHAQLRREVPGHTLDSAALVHEAYLKLVDQTRAQWSDRSHFFAVATQVMRRILVDYARAYRTAKRGGEFERIDLKDESLAAAGRADTMIALDEALMRLETVDGRLSRVVECRFFGGLTEHETAEVLGVNPRTVRRDWAKARGWLHQALSSD
jgi:RNA polymerase sigma factor (TIGR02999 family)